MSCVLSICQLLSIVFGFFQDSFTGVEQGPGHMVQAGYQKGAAQAGQNLVFNVMDRTATASELMSTMNVFLHHLNNSPELQERARLLTIQ